MRNIEQQVERKRVNNIMYGDKEDSSEFMTVSKHQKGRNAFSALFDHYKFKT